MFVDKEGELSDEQVLTATAASTNHIDTNNIVNRAGEPLKLVLAIDTTLDSAGDAATLVIAIRESATAAMANPVVIAQTAAIAEADLVAGALIDLPTIPQKTLRYLDAYYTVGTEDFTTGALSLGFVVDKQSNGAAAIAEQNALL